MRIRTIKPEFWRSDDIDALCIADRLLFIGLWSYVDDSGVGVDKESAIAADLFAGDLADDPHECSVRVHGGLNRLAQAGLIVRYVVDGRRYIHITSWAKHQRINRPSESRHPAPTSENAIPLTVLDEHSVSPQEESPLGTGEQGNRGEKTSSPAPRAMHTEDPYFAKFWDVYPRKVGKGEARKAWAKLIKAGVDPADIIAGAERYRDDPKRRSKDIEFTKHPGPWLNAERWTDAEASGQDQEPKGWWNN